MTVEETEQRRKTLYLIGEHFAAFRNCPGALEKLGPEMKILNQIGLGLMREHSTSVPSFSSAAPATEK